MNWFHGENRPAGHVLFKFSPTSIRDGLRLLEKDGLITRSWIKRDPRNNARKYARRHRFYANNFA